MTGNKDKVSKKDGYEGSGYTPYTARGTAVPTTNEKVVYARYSTQAFSIGC